MALRELLALFQVKVEGLDQLTAVDGAFNAAKGGASGFARATDTASSAAQSGAEAVKSLADATNSAFEASKATTAAIFGQDVASSALRTGIYSLLAVMVPAIAKTTLFSSAVRTLAFAAAGLGMARVTKTVFEMVEGTTQAVNEIGGLAIALGLSAEAAQKWQHLAEGEGATLDQLRGSFGSLSRAVSMAADKASPAAKLFEDLGVSLGDADNPRDFEDVLIDTTAALANTEDQAKKLATTQALLGEAGVKLLPTFKNNAAAMREELEAAGALGGVFSNEFVEAARKTNTNLQFMRNQFGVLRSQLVAEFLPAFDWLVSGIAKGVGTFRAWLKETDALSRWIKILSISGATRFFSLIAAHSSTISGLLGKIARILAPFARMLAVWAAWALVLDDIIVFLQGGDSLLGRFIDRMFGVGASNKVLQRMADLWEIVKNGVALLREVVGWLFDDIKSVGDEATKTSGSFDGWKSAADIVRGLASAVRDLFGWLDKVTGTTKALRSIADVIFEASDHAANVRAEVEAMDRAREKSTKPANPKAQKALEAAAKVGAVPQVASAPITVHQSSSTHTDNSRVSVTLTGEQSPETVREAGAEARRIQKNKAAQNALIRGAT